MSNYEAVQAIGAGSDIRSHILYSLLGVTSPNDDFEFTFRTKGKEFSLEMGRVKINLATRTVSFSIEELVEGTKGHQWEVIKEEKASLISEFEVKEFMKLLSNYREGKV